MIESLFSQATSNFRKRLVLLTLFPLSLISIGILLLLLIWSRQVGYGQLLMRANTDLAVAHDAFSNFQEEYQVRLALSVASYELNGGILDPVMFKSGLYIDRISPLLKQAGFDFYHILDAQGCKFSNQDCDYPSQGLIKKAIQSGPSNGVEVLTNNELNQLSSDLAQKAKISIIQTERANPSNRVVEDRGMVMHFIHPIRKTNGEIVALISAGILMNRNLEFVDRISSTVYGSGSLPEGGVGTVTLFLDDVRITTNVKHPDSPDRRALGTRVSSQVKEQVLEKGLKWLDRAFVVNDWYISGYEPVIDVDGNKIGMLYAGFLESPFMESFYYWLEILLLLFAVVALFGVGIGIYGARAISRPVEAIIAVSDDIKAGKRKRIPKLRAAYEINQLVEHFNEMLDRLDYQHDEIQAAKSELEMRVRDRTKELERHIQLLNRTREQLIEKGKLAALGELTAGIAHEVNNPTAVILGHIDLILDELGKDIPTSAKKDFDLIVEQVARIRTLTNDLLTLARTGDSEPAKIQDLDLNQLINGTKTLVQHELSRRGILLSLDLKTDRLVMADSSQLQQVLINLVMNSANAITDNGKIIIRTRDLRSGGVVLTVRDNGKGIEDQYISRIFDPFFTRTAGGTGLGLSISLKLLIQMGAQLSVKSKLGKGTVFFIKLCSSGV